MTHGTIMASNRLAISMEFHPEGWGWADLFLQVGGDDFRFTVSHIGDSLSEFVERVYYLFPLLDHDDYSPDNADYKDVDMPAEDLPAGIALESHETVTVTMPWKASVTLDGEGPFAILTFERALDLEADSNLQLTLERAGYKDLADGQREIRKYTIGYRDLCYAVAKCATEVLTECGLNGLYESTWMPDINLRHLLLLKEIALGEKLPFAAQDTKGDLYHSSLEAELAFLTRPMPDKTETK